MAFSTPAQSFLSIFWGFQSTFRLKGGSLKTVQSKQRWQSLAESLDGAETKPLEKEAKCRKVLISSHFPASFVLFSRCLNYRLRGNISLWRFCQLPEEILRKSVAPYVACHITVGAVLLISSVNELVETLWTDVFLAAAGVSVLTGIVQPGLCSCFLYKQILLFLKYPHLILITVNEIDQLRNTGNRPAEYIEQIQGQDRMKMGKNRKDPNYPKDAGA